MKLFKMHSVMLLSILSLALIPTFIVADPNVTVAQGMLVGETVRFTEENFIGVVEKEFDIYLGVPFADPPRRFKPPTPIQPWNETLNVKEFKEACMQATPTLDTTISEDCLYLNVYSPSPKPTNAAVMVWVHGGGFVAGTASNYEYYGVPLVAVGNVIVVTINYRLGVFGKLTTKDSEAPGNVGMLDQVAALQWIRDNIAAFGGDKNRITLFGESAGGASVDFLTLSKLSRDLFYQAVIQSGSTSPNWAFEQNPPETEVQNAMNLGQVLGCDTSTTSALIACLETKNAYEILTNSFLTYALSPVSVDGYFLDDTPSNLYKNGDFKRCPVLTGFNRDEGTLLFPFLFPIDNLDQPRPEVDRTAFNNLIRARMNESGITDDVLLEAILQEYTDWTIADNSSANMMPSFIEFVGDQGFACPSDQFTRAHTNVGDTVFTYFLTIEPSSNFFQPYPDWFGAGHGVDVVFLFGMPFIEQLSGRGFTMTDEEKVLSVKIMKLWTNFAKFGNPTEGANLDEGLGTWPAYSIPELAYKEISLSLDQGRALKAKQCRFWNNYFPKLQKFVASMDIGLADWQEEFNGWQAHMTDWQMAYEKYKEAEPCN